MKKISYLFYSLLEICICFLLFKNSFTQDLSPLINYPETFNSVVFQNSKNLTGSNQQSSVVTVLSHDGYHSRHSAPQSLFRYARCYFLILASEMNSSGFPSGVNITSLGYNYKYGTDLSTKGNFKVYFQNTNDVTNNKSMNWNLAITGMTLVHSDSLKIPLSDGPFDIPLNQSNAFVYSGGGIYVAFEYSNPAGPLALYSNVAWCNRVQPNPILKSSQSDDSIRVMATGTSNLRPEMRFGTSLIDIASAGPVYSMGMNSVQPCPDTVSVKAVINHLRNVRDTIIVTTQIKRVSDGFVKHSFADTFISDSAESKIIINKYLSDSELSLDSVIVTASVSGEDITGNNRSVYLIKTTVNSQSYYIPSMPPAGGVGLSVGTGDYVARFHTPCSLSVCAADLSFYAESGQGSTPYKVVFFAADGPGGLPGTLLHSSALRTSPVSQSGVIKRSVYFLPAPLLINPGYYYAGYTQTEERNLRVSYQTETPIRKGEFFYTTPAGAGNWTEFAWISPYRFDISLRTYLQLNLKAYLQGFYNGTKMISDTVKVFVRSRTSPYNILDSSSAVLDTNGNGLFSFINANSDSCYYFDVRHRNHLRTFSSSSCQKLNGIPASYDFTNSSSKAFGNNMTEVSAGKFAFYGGDINQDGTIDATDVSSVDNAALSSLSGYVRTDVTGDGFVDGSDLSLAENNAYAGINAIIP
ncbi:MAG: hypothetical protein IPJ45_07985 [Ignavibacteria bacterium]|nr:hypothetical protein [Ignavibacteria bacterium]